MLVKLIQPISEVEGRTVDIAGSVDRLDFSRLRGSTAWKINVIWDTCEECIARVVWKSAAGYMMYTRKGAVDGAARIINHQGSIIPDVKRRLQQLFRSGGICQESGQQPLVLVEPTE